MKKMNEIEFFLHIFHLNIFLRQILERGGGRKVGGSACRSRGQGQIICVSLNGKNLLVKMQVKVLTYTT